MANEITQTVKIEASLTQIQGQLKTLEGNFRTSFANIGATASSALGAFGVGLGVAGLVAFGKSVMDTVGHLQDLADQTGLNAQTLSGLKPELENAGISLDQFAKGVLIAQKTLGGIDDESKGAGAAIKALGLDLEDLQNSTPDEFLDKVSRALATVGNEFERKALSAKIFGKAGADTANAMATLAGRLDELRSKGLSAETIAKMDALGDSINTLKNNLINFSAEPLLHTLGAISETLAGLGDIWRALGGGDFGKTVASAWTAALDQATIGALALQGGLLGIIRLAPLAAEALTFNQLDFGSRRLGQGMADLEKRIDAVINKGRDLRAAGAADVGGAAGLLPKRTFENRLGRAEAAGGATRKAKSEIDSFFNSLNKQIDSINQKEIELRLGPSAGLAAGLDQQFEALKENLRTKGLPIPAGLDEFFTKLKERVIASNQELARTTQEMQKIEDLAKILNADSADWLTATEEAAKHAADELAKLEPQFRDLQKSLAIEIIPEDQRGTAQAIQQFSDRTKAIQEWRAAAIRAGQDVEKVNREAAQATHDAWIAAQDQMKQGADEVTEFWRSATEGVQNAVAGGIEDMLSGNIKSWEDWGDSIKKVLDRVVAQFLAAQLNTGLFGNQTSSGGQVGGLFGEIFSMFGSGGGGGAATSQMAGAFDTAEMFMWHQGGEIREGSAHSGVRRLQASLLPRMHGGGEVPIMAQSGEFMMRSSSAQRIGSPALNFMNATGAIPGASGRGPRGDTFNFSFNGVQDMDSFRRSRTQLMADLGRAVRRGNKNL